MRTLDPYKFDLFAVSGVEMADSSYSNLPLRKGKRKIPFIAAGVDEAGRGPLAGPVVAAAVILPAYPRVKILDDSKSLNDIQRLKSYNQIKEVALAISFSIIEPAVIDELNILWASMKAMRDAIASLKIRPDLVLIDGNRKPMSSCRELALIKGDTKSAAIMAASIVAKVTRDRLMEDHHKQYPEYGFDVHKGYGVPMHLEALQKYGPCPIHRRSFGPVREILHTLSPSERKIEHERGDIREQAELF